ncbi:MAG: heavy-metal-associated domain-containing protein [Gammaproteobacteria bacterium]
MQEEFNVKNVKCAGCVAAIQQALGALPGVTEVEVIIEGGRVRVRGDGLDRARLSTKLTELGYPEAG